jgi:GH18 family chitinase/chitodextrinase
MKIFTRILKVTTVFLIANGVLFQAHGQRIIGYMPSWAGDANAIQYSKLTHINYAFALPTSDGSIKAIDNPAKLQTIVSKAHAVGTKVMIAVGGWSDGGTPLDPTFEALAGNATSRSRFVTACMNLVSQYGVDGIDIDWEYPDAGQSSTNFDLLMTALSDQLKPQGKLLSAAVIGNGTTGNGVSTTVFSKVDWLNVMSYDANDFQHSTYDYSLQCLSYWSGRGIAKSKINLGVPFYGRPSWESYATLVGRGADPNADVFGNVGYNGLTTIKKKTQYVKDNAYGGMMIWELSQDLGNQNSLLSAMFAITGGTTPPPPPPATQSPYGGTAAAIPGKVEAEKYDLGGQTIAYSDNTAGNSGNTFRTDDVDVEATTDAGAGYNIGYTAAGEWLEYTVNVTAGTYKLEARVAATLAGKSFHVEMNGVNIGNISVPNTGGWQTWQTVTLSNISLTAGQKVMRIYFDTDGINLNYVNFSTGTTPPPPTNQAPTVSITGPANNTNYNAPASVNITANAADADGTVSKVDFYNGGALLGTDNSAPYSFGWTNVAAGTYTLTAKATDNSGAVTTSGAITIVVKTVTPPPGGTCTTPAWSASAVYVAGNRASRSGNIYEAKWWTQGDDPLLSGQWDVWKNIGACNAKINMADNADVSTSNYISVNPNPSNGFLFVEMNTIDASSVEVQIFDSFGHKVFSEANIQSGAAINIQSLSAGIYIMKIKAGEQILTQRLVRQ